MESFLVCGVSQWATHSWVPEEQIVVPFHPKMEHAKQTEIVGKGRRRPLTWCDLLSEVNGQL